MKQRVVSIYVAILTLSYFPPPTQKEVLSKGLTVAPDFPHALSATPPSSNRFCDLLLSDMIILLAIKQYVNQFFDLLPFSLP